MDNPILKADFPGPTDTLFYIQYGAKRVISEWFYNAQSQGVAAHRIQRIDVLQNTAMKNLPGKLLW